MNKSQIKKQKYIRERKLKHRTFLSIIIHIIILILFCIYTKEVNESYNYETIKPYNHMDYHVEGMYDTNTYTNIWHSRNLELICESDGMRFYK